MSNVKIALLGSIVISNVIVRLHLSGKRVFAVLKHSQQIKSDVIPIISGETEIIFAPRHYSITNPSSIDSIKEAKNSLDLAYNRLFEAVCFPILHREAIGKFGLDLPKGVLISGPPGVGKTSLVRRIANVAKVPLLTIRGPELIGQNLGESEANLTERFRLAREAAEDTPLKVSILFLDEIDSIAMKRAAPSQSSSSIRLVSQLLILMDGIGSKISSEHSTVVVIAATNRPNTIDPALRRPGRFDREITIDPPNATERLEMLRGMIEEIPNIQCNANLQELAKATAGFVAADLNALLREAFLSSIDSLTPTILSDADFAAALKNVRPSLHREYSIAVEPNVTFESIGGYAQVKESLQRSLEWPLLHAASFARLGIRPPRGILLHGPPGCSKTTFAKAIANMASLNFYSLSGASVLSSYYGESERTIRTIFQNARLTKPSVVFIDELDALVGKRVDDRQKHSQGGSDVSTRILTTFLNEMDGIEQCEGVFVLAATNRLHAIDAALLRPGRFDQLIEVGLPDATSRREILKVRLGKTPIDKDVLLDALVESTESYSGAMLCQLVQEAALTAISQGRELVTMEDFMVHLKRTNVK